MQKYFYSLLLMISLGSHAETYDDDGYCQTDKYQEIKKCLRHNLDLAQKKIDDLSSIYIAELKNDGAEGFDEASTQWQEYVSSTCRLHSTSAGNGSVKPIRAMSCQLHAKERRIIELGCMISYHLGDGNKYQKYCGKYFDTRMKI